MPVCKRHQMEYVKNCRLCANESQKRYRMRRKIEVAELVWGIKNASVCTVCGNSYHPVAMDFHHRDPETKRFEMTRAAMYSDKVVLEEIEKCDLYCAICHRVKHFNENKGEWR